LDGAARDGAYAGAPNGRVREVPDQRAIRWYASTGLVDRPLGGRGRGARYTARHLLQLVAIKRLQAAGLTLAEIQARLAGAGDETLQIVAEVAPGLLEAGAPDAGPSDGRTLSSASTPAGPVECHAAGAPARFWASVPPGSSAVPAAPSRTAAAGESQAPQEFSVPTGLGIALPLGNGVVLVLPPVAAVAGAGHAPLELTPTQHASVERAWRPLRDLLAVLGLVDNPAPESLEGAHR
jgi:DNA-binding transcriptional MerR regulator